MNAFGLTNALAARVGYTRRALYAGAAPKVMGAACDGSGGGVRYRGCSNLTVHNQEGEERQNAARKIIEVLIVVRIWETPHCHHLCQHRAVFVNLSTKGGDARRGKGTDNAPKHSDKGTERGDDAPGRTEDQPEAGKHG